MACVVSMPTLLMALHCFLHFARHLWTLGLWALGVARVGAIRMMTLLMANPNRLEHLALLLELRPWLWARFVASHVPAARLVAGLHFLHFVLHCLVEMLMVVFVLLAVVVPPLAMLDFGILFRIMVMVIGMMKALGIVVHFAIKMPETPHLGAGVMAHVVSGGALPMAFDVVLHCCTL